MINLSHSFGGAVAQLGARLDGIEEVVGSNPIGSTNLTQVRPGDIGDSSYRRHGLHFWAERIFDRFEHSSLQIKVSQIIIHKAHQPNVVVDFSDADGLTGEDRTEVDFLAAQTDSIITRDHD